VIDRLWFRSLASLAVAHIYGQTRSHVATFPAVATCRQTVEALTRAAVHRLAADGYGLPADGYDSARYMWDTSPNVLNHPAPNALHDLLTLGQNKPYIHNASPPFPLKIPPNRKNRPSLPNPHNPSLPILGTT
jgi:hypothetical protein